MKHVPYSTKLALYKLICGSKLKLFLGKIYLLLTKYQIDENYKNSNDIIFIINHERVYREDHIKQFKYIYDNINNALGYKTTYFEIKRVFNWNFPRVIKSIVKNRNFFYIINSQMNDVFVKIHDSQIKKVVVFCDTVPLQNYICECYKDSNVETYSLQHGFYISDDNKSFELVYRSSNAKNFFVWDKRTLKFMKKHNEGRNRNFIKAGPLSRKLYTHSKIESKNNNDIQSIAIYGCGKDQVEQNEYLVDLYKYLKMHSKLEVVFISHPIFKIFFRLRQSFKYKIFFEDNQKKYGQYDLHLVLNSGVWLELEEQGKRYYLLNNDFDKKLSLSQASINCFKKQAALNKNELQPFFKNMDVVKIIQQEITSNIRVKGNDI